MNKEEIKKILEKKKWFRFLKVLGYFILIFSFLAPTIMGYSYIKETIGGENFFNGIINFAVWFLILKIIKRIIIYIVFGPKEDWENK